MPVPGDAVGGGGAAWWVRVGTCLQQAGRVTAIAERYVELALAQADFSEVCELAIDETAKAKGHQYVTIAADAERCAVLFVTDLPAAGRDSGSGRH